MVVQARTTAGDPVEIKLHPMVSWALGIAASLIVASVVGAAGLFWQQNARINEVNSTVIENRGRINTTEAAMLQRSDFVTVREYDAHVIAITQQLDRIEALIRDGR